MTKIIYKLILISLILPIHFSQAELSEANLEKKYKIYGVIKDIREELDEFEHSKEQVSKSHKMLNKVLVTLTDDYGDEESQPTITISGRPVYDFGDLTSIVDKQHTFLLQKTGNAPIINLTIKPLSSPFRFGSGPIGRQFPGTTGTCDPDYIVADCTFIVSTRARIKGVFSDTIQINYTLEDGSSHTITQELRARYR